MNSFLSGPVLPKNYLNGGSAKISKSFSKPKPVTSTVLQSFVQYWGQQYQNWLNSFLKKSLQLNFPKKPVISLKDQESSAIIGWTSKGSQELLSSKSNLISLSWKWGHFSRILKNNHFKLTNTYFLISLKETNEVKLPYILEELFSYFDEHPEKIK